MRGGRIADITDRPGTITSQHPQATVIDASDRLIVPGFVNAHFHGQSLLLRWRTKNKHMALWSRDRHLQGAISRLCAPGSEDDVRMLYLATYFNHLKAGTTSVGEFPPQAGDAGFTQLLQAIQRTEVNTVVALQNWDQIRHARDAGNGRSGFMISMGREEDYTVYSLENLLQAADESGLPVLAHVAEQREEAEVVKKNFQKGLLPVLRDFGALKRETCLVHLNHVQEADIALARNAESGVVVCPRSAMWKQTGYPALRTLLEEAVRPSLGTDWGEMDMLGEMQFLYQLQFLLSGFPRLTPLDILRMGTINGAHALGIAGDRGSIEVGKRADLTFLSLGSIGIPPVHDRPSAQGLAALLLTSMNTSHVSDVMIDGEFYVSKGQIMTMSEEDILAGVRGLLERYFPQQRSSSGRSDMGPPLKIIPFVPDLRKSEQPVENFEQGISPQAPETTDAPPPPAQPGTAPPAEPDNRPLSLPQLSKNVKRVFGEDDNI